MDRFWVGLGGGGRLWGGRAGPRPKPLHGRGVGLGGVARRGRQRPHPSRGELRRRAQQVKRIQPVQGWVEAGSMEKRRKVEGLT